MLQRDNLYAALFNLSSDSLEKQDINDVTHTSNNQILSRAIVKSEKNHNNEQETSLNVIIIESRKTVFWRAMSRKS